MANNNPPKKDLIARFLTVFGDIKFSQGPFSSSMTRAATWLKART